MAFGFGFGMPRIFSASRAFNPASLFANGEQGWWYDPSNFATLFQDAAGTTPVTAVEQPVGLQLDLSKGLVLGPELVTNAADRNFTSNTGYWTLEDANWNISGNALNKTASSLSSCTHNGVLTTGVGFSVTITIASISGGILYVNQGTAFGAAITAPGTYTFPFIATGARIGFTSGLGAVFSITNVSYKPLAGNHRFQTTSANRPVVSARVNLLTKTEQFDDGVWQRAGGIPAPTTYTGTTPLGTTGTIYRFTFSSVAASVLSLIYQNTTSPQSIAAGQKFGLWAKRVSGGDKLGISMQTAGGSPTAGTFISGVKTVSADWTQIDVQGTFPSPSGNVGVTVGFDGRIAEQQNLSTITVDIWGADLRVANIGVGLPAYQRVNTSTDYDSTGFPVYIKPNGSNQFMVTNSINFSATDKMTVWQGVRKLSDAANGVLVELSSSISANNGVFTIQAPQGASAPFNHYTFASKGTAFGLATTATGYPSPITNVLTGIGDISGDIATLRINGVQTAQGIENQGTGNFGNYPAYFYARGGASLYFNGHDYGSIARGAASTAAQITAGETYINSKTKAY